MKIIASYREIMVSGYWSEFCQDRGINEWAVNRGLLDPDERVELSFAEAKRYGLTK